MSQSLGVFVSIIPAQLTKKCPITTSVYCLSMSRDMPSLILVKIRILLICIYIYSLSDLSVLNIRTTE